MTASAPQSKNAKPHWRRTQQVYAVLNQAPPEATYNELIAYVCSQTGKGCSRKLISKWKKERQDNSQVLTAIAEPSKAEGTSILAIEGEQGHHAPIEAPSKQDRRQEVDGRRLVLEGDSTRYQKTSARSQVLPENPDPISPARSGQKGWWNRLTTTAAAITIGLAGCSGFIPSKNDTPHTTAAVATTVVSPVVSPNENPPSKNQLPRQIKIQLTLSNPQELRVKQGERVVRGQVLADRSAERGRLLAQKKQLQLSLQKLNVPSSQPIAPKPIPSLGELPPVSYQEEITKIELAQQESHQAAIALSLQQERVAKMEAIAEIYPAIKILEEKAKLSQLTTDLEKSQTQLDLAKSQLEQAKIQRAYLEKQHEREKANLEIAVRQQQLEIERVEAEQQRQRQLTEYNRAQLESQIAQIDNALAQLAAVKAPYSGTIEKIKWVNQSNNVLTAELTLHLRD
jgi:hypothetical protein